MRPTEERTEKRIETHACDLISRQQAIDALQKCRKHCIDPFDSYHIDIQDAEYQLSKVPAVQAERAEGEWIPVQRHEGDTQPDLECPFCKHRIGWFDMGRYCAGCGAKLKGGAG